MLFFVGKEPKHGNRIVSRKITKTISLTNLSKADKLQANAEAFVAEVKLVIKAIRRVNVYNADYSGFNLGMCSGK